MSARIALLALALVNTIGSVFAASAKPAVDPFSYSRVDIAPGIVLFGEFALRGFVSGNIIAIVGDDSALVFDSGHHPRVTRRIIGEIKALTKKPVRYVVNSHWHDDHFAGNAEFAQAYPDVQFIALPFTAQLMETRKDKLGGAPCKAEIKTDLDGIRPLVASGKRADGSALSEAGRAYLAHVMLEGEAQLAECDVYRYRGTDLTFEDKLDIELGHRIVSLRFLGRANTAGDIVAYVPDAKVLLTGDILVRPIPYATQSYIGEWAAVLDKLDAIDATVIVPGHGEPMRDKSYLHDVRDVLASIDTQARANYKPGMTLDEFRKAIDLAPHRAKLAGDDKLLGSAFDGMLGQSALDRAFQEREGALKPEGV